jgi:hypothetical protein
MTAPPKLIVFLVVMIQWVALLLGFGGLVPYLYERGSNPVLLAVGAVAALPSFKPLLAFSSAKFRSAAYSAAIERDSPVLDGGPSAIVSIAKPADASIASSSSGGRAEA